MDKLNSTDRAVSGLQMQPNPLSTICVARINRLAYLCLWRNFRLRPGWKILPIRMGYCSNTNRFRSEDNNVVMHMKLHYYRMQQVEPCHLLVEITRRYSWAIYLLALWQNNNSKDNENYLERVKRASPMGKHMFHGWLVQTKGAPAFQTLLFSLNLGEVRDVRANYIPIRCAI